MINHLITAVVVACSVASCGVRPSNEATPIPAVEIPCEGNVTVWDGQPVPCNLTPPQTLDVLLNVVDEDAQEAERQCDDMGGDVTWDDDLPAWRCQNVDY